MEALAPWAMPILRALAAAIAPMTRRSGTRLLIIAAMRRHRARTQRLAVPTPHLYAATRRLAARIPRQAPATLRRAAHTRPQAALIQHQAGVIPRRADPIQHQATALPLLVAVLVAAAVVVVLEAAEVVELHMVAAVAVLTPIDKDFSTVHLGPPRSMMAGLFFVRTLFKRKT
jgi:hypothetical protein